MPPTGPGKPEPCPEPSCKSSAEALQRSLAFAFNSSPRPSPTTQPRPTSSQPLPLPSSFSASTSPPPAASASPYDCPLNRESLGHFTWGVLHTVAAYYPDSPSPSEKVGARELIKSLAALYPCEHCKEDFKSAVAKRPPEVESRKDFSIYVCEMVSGVLDDAKHRYGRVPNYFLRLTR